MADIKQSRRNHLYSKAIDHTVVEEYLDSVFEDDPIPMPVTNAIKKVATRFQCNKEYTGRSIHDAVHDYYDSRFGGAARIRNMRVAMSNNCRTVSDVTRRKMSQSQMGNHNRLGKFKV